VDKPDQQRDFFVSYTQADRAWAEWIAWELEAAGYTTVLQAWDMPAGTAFVHAMNQAVQQTHHTLLVLSPAYLRSEMTEAEWRPGFRADPSGEARRLLPVRVEDCQPAGLLADRVWIDLVATDEATARARLREEIPRALRGPGRPATPPRFPRALVQAAVDRPRFPTALPGVWNVPYRRNPDFTGREQPLADLAAQLGQGAATAVTQALQGAGGVGKTALAVEYAYRHRAEFDTVWWVRAEEPATLVGDLADLAVALRLPGAGQADQQLAVLAVRRWLDDHDRWLLVLDNAQAPDTPTGLQAPLARLIDLVPQVLHGQVLVTSRDTSWGEHAALAELEVFTPEEAVAFLLARSGSSDQATAAEIAELLGWLPLALEQAGAYVRETRIPLATYLDRLREFPTLTMAKGRPRDRDPADTVATTWQVSLEGVRSVPGAVSLLEVCAFLGPEEIPRKLFTQELDPLADDLAGLVDDPFTLDEAIAALRRFALAKASEQTLSVHRLVQQVIRDRLDPGQRRHRAAAAQRLVSEAFPTERDPEAWPVQADLLPHVLAVTGHAQALSVDLGTTGWLLTKAGGYLWERADHQPARTLFQRALAINEDRLGPQHPSTATSLQHLAYILHAQGELHTARTHHQRALAIREAQFGPDHPDTAQSLADLAGTLFGLGDLEGARVLHERALAIRKICHGADHLRTASSLSNLAEVVRAQGDLDRARLLNERALTIRETHLAPDHPHIAHSIRKLAGVLRDQGNLDTAHILSERALGNFEARLGADHPTTAQSLNNLALVLYDQGDLDQARTLLQRALAIREARLGPDHPSTATSLNNLALVLRGQGDLNAARPLLERALAIREARLGPDHPTTAQGLNNLALVLADQGDLDAARRLHERALASFEARLGADHPDTARSRKDLSAVVAALDEQW
jgi:tetratricopeptide (TPR) repeat protein